MVAVLRAPRRAFATGAGQLAGRKALGSGQRPQCSEPFIGGGRRPRLEHYSVTIEACFGPESCSLRCGSRVALRAGTICMESAMRTEKLYLACLASSILALGMVLSADVLGQAAAHHCRQQRGHGCGRSAIASDGFRTSIPNCTRNA
jgi:hypothetical protein